MKLRCNLHTVCSFCLFHSILRYTVVESLDTSMDKISAMEKMFNEFSSDEELDKEEEQELSEVSSPEHTIHSGSELGTESECDELSFQ